jgi:hypothetical protein
MTHECPYIERRKAAGLTCKVWCCACHDQSVTDRRTSRRTKLFSMVKRILPTPERSLGVLRSASQERFGVQRIVFECIQRTPDRGTFRRGAHCFVSIGYSASSCFIIDESREYVIHPFSSTDSYANRRQRRKAFNASCCACRFAGS